jgi:hypothetical protein
VFKKWGKNPEILWEVKGGDWEVREPWRDH